MSKNRKKNFAITPKDILNGMKKINREDMLSQGAQTLRASVAHKSVKDYDRTRKHKNQEY
jgi:hypothetical protein